MKVKILSGNQTGAVIEMRQDEAEAAIATGYGEAVAEDGSPLKASVGQLVQTHPAETANVKPKAKGKGKGK